MRKYKRYIYISLAVILVYYGYQYSKIKPVILKNTEPIEFITPIVSVFQSFEETEIVEEDILTEFYETEKELVNSFANTSWGSILSDSERAYTRFTRSKRSINNAIPILERIREGFSKIPQYNDRISNSREILLGHIDDLIQACRSQVRVIDALGDGSYLSMVTNGASLIDASARLSHFVPPTTGDEFSFEEVKFFIDLLAENPYLLDYSYDLLGIMNDLNTIENESWFMGPRMTAFLGGLASWMNSNQEGAVYGSGLSFYLLGAGLTISNDEFYDRLFSLQIGKITASNLNVRPNCDFGDKGKFPQISKGTYVLLGAQNLSDFDEVLELDEVENDCDNGLMIFTSHSSSQPIVGIVHEKYVDVLSREEVTDQLPDIGRQLKKLLDWVESEKSTI